MSRKELVAMVAVIVTCASTLFGIMAYGESHFVDKDELAGYMIQIVTRLQSIEETLRAP